MIGECETHPSIREGVVGQGLGHAALDQIGRGVHPGGTQVFDDRPSFTVGRLTVLLGMDSLEHVAHLANLGCRHVTEDVPVEMNHAALPARLRQILCGAFHQAAAGIGDDELHAIEPTIDQVA